MLVHGDRLLLRGSDAFDLEVSLYDLAQQHQIWQKKLDCRSLQFGRDLVLIDHSLWNAVKDEEVGRAAAVNERDEVVWLEGWELRWRERTFQCEYEPGQVVLSPAGEWLAVSDGARGWLWDGLRQRHFRGSSASTLPLLLDPEHELFGLAGCLWHSASGDLLLRLEDDNWSDWSYDGLRGRLLVTGREGVRVYGLPDPRPLTAMNRELLLRRLELAYRDEEKALWQTALERKSHAPA